VDGRQPSTCNQLAIADKLLRDGVLHRDGRTYIAECVEAPEETNRYLIWLPNQLVTGKVSREPSPVARVRRSGDVMALRLLVDLYHDQNLRDDGGISRRVLMQEFRRDQVGTAQRYNVFAFTPGDYKARRTGAAAGHFEGADGSAFFARLSILQNCGLIDFVPHLCESANPDSEIIHPCGLDWTQEGLRDPENEVGCEANEAAKMMADLAKYVEAGMGGAKLFIPVRKDYPDAQVVGSHECSTDRVHGEQSNGKTKTRLFCCRPTSSIMQNFGEIQSGGVPDWLLEGSDR
jgi:hypothetical protein